MKRYGYTYSETIKNYDGDNIVFSPQVIVNFWKNEYYKNFLTLTEEEKNEWFSISYKYGWQRRN